MSAIDRVPAAGHERRDVQPRTIVLWGAGIFGLVLFTVGAMWIFVQFLRAREERLSPPASPLAGYAPQEPPAPRLQTDPRADLQRLRDRERVELETYGWVDRDTGAVRIPIDRAMELLTARRTRPAP